MISEYINRVYPLVFTFFLGVILKQLKVFNKEDGALLLRVVFYITLPAIIFSVLSQQRFEIESLFIPFCTIVVSPSCFFVAKLFISKRHYPTQTIGAFLTSSFIMNTTVVISFLQVLVEQKTLALIFLYDAMNAIIIFTVGYYIACKHNPDTKQSSTQISKIIKSAPMWTVFLGLACSFLNYTPPDFVLNPLKSIGSLTSTLVLLALGFIFEHRIPTIKLALQAVFIRMFFGGAIAYLFSLVFQLNPNITLVIVLASSAPVGFNTLTFATMQNLDTRLAASTVSISLLISIALIPILSWLLTY